MSDFYELVEPTEWASPPEVWSSSRLDDVEKCPRRWQLLNSRWGDLERFPARLRPATIEGQIVHEALDRLARACGQRGNPAFGTPGFAEAMSEALFFQGFAEALQEWNGRHSRHPRNGPPFRIRASAQELANRAVRLFREQYKTGPGIEKASTGPKGPVELARLLRIKGALSELRLTHPSLPFGGFIDRVQGSLEGVEIVDFKTGRENAAHRQQLLRYAILWWRCTGEAPACVTAQYLGGRETWAIDQLQLTEAEALIEGQIAALAADLSSHPAVARPDEGCRWCPVRARCDEGWTVIESIARSEGRCDAELVVSGTPGDHGFLASDRSGAEIAVVHAAAVAAHVPLFGVGQVIRVVDGVTRSKGKELEIKAWTEVYPVPDGRQDAR